MKWIKLIIDIALVLIPGLGLKAKKDIEKELEIARATIHVLGKDKNYTEKRQAVEDALGVLLKVTGVKARLAKKLDKARNRLYKKLF